MNGDGHLHSKSVGLIQIANGEPVGVVPVYQHQHADDAPFAHKGNAHHGRNGFGVRQLHANFSVLGELVDVLAFASGQDGAGKAVWVIGRGADVGKRFFAIPLGRQSDQLILLIELPNVHPIYAKNAQALLADEAEHGGQVQRGVDGETDTAEGGHKALPLKNVLKKLNLFQGHTGLVHQRPQNLQLVLIKIAVLAVVGQHNRPKRFTAAQNGHEADVVGDARQEPTGGIGQVGMVVEAHLAHQPSVVLE